MVNAMARFYRYSGHLAPGQPPNDSVLPGTEARDTFLRVGPVQVAVHKGDTWRIPNEASFLLTYI